MTNAADVADAVQAMREYATNGKPTAVQHDYIVRAEIARLAGFSGYCDIGVGDRMAARWIIDLYDALSAYTLTDAGRDVAAQVRGGYTLTGQDRTLMNKLREVVAGRGSTTGREDGRITDLIRRLIGMTTNNESRIVVYQDNAAVILAIIETLAQRPAAQTPAAQEPTITSAAPHPVLHAIAVARANADEDGEVQRRDMLAVAGALMSYLASIGMVEPAAAPSGFTRMIEFAMSGAGVSLDYLAIIEEIFTAHHTAYTK